MQHVHASAESSQGDDLYRALFGYAADAMLLVHGSTRQVIAANARFEQLGGYEQGTLLGIAAETLLSGSGFGGGTSLLEMPGLHDDARLQRADGETAWVSVAISLIPAEGQPHIACIVRDTTARRLLERELITKHSALLRTHEELYENTRRLEHRNRELQALTTKIAHLAKIAAVGEMTAGVAHSINNPLAVVLATGRRVLALLERGDSGAPDVAAGGGATQDLAHTEPRKVLRELVLRQQNAAERIRRVVGEMRQAQRNARPRTNSGWVCVVHELRAAMSLFQHRIGDGIDVSWSLPQFSGDPCVHCEGADGHLGAVSLRAYPDELQHLFGNLIDNALRAIGDSGRLGVQVQLVGDECVVTVDDDGCGLPKEIASRLFEPFVTASADGTGLGLATALRIAHRHGGGVTVIPKVGPGTRFAVTLRGCESDSKSERSPENREESA